FMRSPRQRERVKDLRALMRIVAEERPADVRRLLGDPPEAAAMPPEATPPGAQGVVRRWPRPGGWGPRAAVQRWAWAAALVGALGGSWWMVKTLEWRAQVKSLQGERQTLQQKAQDLQQQVTEQRTLRDQLAAELQNLRERYAKLEH